MTATTAILLLITTLSAALGSAAKNKVAKKILKTQSDNLCFSFVINIFCMLIMFLNARTFSIHRDTFLLAIAFGAASMMSGLMSMVSLRYGPMSLTSLICSGGSLIISTVLGTILFHETVVPIQIVGFVLILVVILLLSRTDKEKNIHPRWFTTVALSAIFTGSTGIIQKFQGASAYADEKPVFLLYTFLFCSLFNGVWLTLHRNTGKKEPITYSLKQILPIAAIAGMTCAITNIINLKLAIEVPAVIFFPAYSGGLIMMSALISALWFREKLSARQKFAFVVGFAAIFMLANVF